jgi:hypothetical protein
VCGQFLVAHRGDCGDERITVFVVEMWAGVKTPARLATARSDRGVAPVLLEQLHRRMSTRTAQIARPSTSHALTCDALQFNPSPHTDTGQTHPFLE